MTVHRYTTTMMRLEDLTPNEENYNEGDVMAVATAIAVDGWHGEVLAQEPTGRRKRARIFAGETRWRALRLLNREGFEFPDGEHRSYDDLLASEVLLPPKGKVPVQLLPLADLRALRKLVADNQAARRAATNEPKLAELLRKLDSEDSLLGSLFAEDDLEALLARLNAEEPKGTKPEAGPTLADRFLVPPFSVLDARRGTWQDRKRKWLDLGIRSELGRPQNLLKMSDTVLDAQAPKRPNKSKPSDSGNDPNFYWKKQEVERQLGRELTTEEFLADHYGGPDTLAGGTSIFDPVLCEIAYRWFCRPGGRVLDPFAGGSVRGIVAAKLGNPYVGIDLSAAQAEENEKQAAQILSGDDVQPRWLVGDARDARRLTADEAPFDLLFTCPPYFNLEQYSDDPADLSNADDFASFISGYERCLAAASKRVADHRFAVIVIGNVRGKGGSLLDLAAATRSGMEAAGWEFYNDAILLTAVGSLALRAARNFALRKLGRTHQYVLVFVKGDVAKAVEACGPLDVPTMEELLAVAEIEPEQIDA